VDGDPGHPTDHPEVVHGQTPPLGMTVEQGEEIGGTSDLRGVYPQKIPVGSASISASSSAMLPGSMKS
jgi:cell shape-determining protein MreC